MPVTSFFNFCHLCKNKAMSITRSTYFDFTVYTFLLISTIFINKYVLSVLKFTYPTVFQAWQTLIGAVILKYLTVKKKLDVSCLDRSSATHLLPHCVFFVGAIVAGSKALSRLPIPVFASVCNLPLACTALLDGCAGVGPGAGASARLLPVTAALLVVGAGVCTIIVDASLPFADSGYSWLLAHVVFLTAQILHARVCDPRYTEFDKIYYSNIFSVVILAPSSLYLEEAFSALHFQHRRQLRFYAGCACSGVLGVLLQLWAARVRACAGRVGVGASGEPGGAQARAPALARLLGSAASVCVFPSDHQLGLAAWLFVALNLLAATCIPASAAAGPDHAPLDDKHVSALNV
ncbi:Uncharacterized protein GBIM_03725 [Gryllus bimaculatus]|nr:Uncharacterized protein GBIM_03725 [Gryllus bimaculatus]